MNIAIIPARGGSLRIPRKNIRQFNGKPMVHYPIELALKAKMFDKVVVSTEDPEVAMIASRVEGVEILDRPEHLAQSDTPTAPVIEHALNAYPGFANACCIYPCSPTLKVRHLKRGFKQRPSMSVQENPKALLALKVSPQGFVSYRWPQFGGTPTQNLPRSVMDAGQFYWVKVSDFLANPVLPQERMKAVLVKGAIDVDTIDDWDRISIIARHSGFK